MHTAMSALAQHVLDLDKSVRSCGIVDRLGNVIASKYRSDFKPLLDDRETERHAITWAIRMSHPQSWEKNLGSTRYILTRYERAIRTIIPMTSAQVMVMVCFDTDIDNFDRILMRSIVPYLDEAFDEGRTGASIHAAS